MTQLRFAPLVRVSTEKQAQQGESLKTQKRQIEDVVALKGGIIPDYCWKYSGQEHATPAIERAKFDQLLKDSSKNLFDAVIVVDLSRWSRDNLHSKQGIETLSRNNIKFFVLSEEVDLNSASGSFQIGIMTEVNEFQARIQKEKSLLNRIERAKRGLPAVGKLPFGRTFDKSTGKWGVDEDKKNDIIKASKMYLDGTPMSKVAKIFGMNHSSLHKILTKRSGNTWEQRFRYPKHAIDETVIINIPRLLPAETIDQIQERAESNKTYTHGIKKYSYLLSSFLFCDFCGYSMFGQTNSRGKRYYRHARMKMRPCSCDGLYLAAEDIENAVMVSVMRNLVDKVGLEKAIHLATPDENKKLELIGELESLNQALFEIDQKKNRLFASIEDGVISKNDVKDRLEKHKESASLIINKISNINNELSTYTTGLQIENAWKQMKDKVQRLQHRENICQGLKETMLEDDYKSFRRLWTMTFLEKREFLQFLFSGKDNSGKRLGVYVKRLDDGKWKYEIRGVVGRPLKGLSPISDQDARDELGIEDSNINPYTGEVLNMHSITQQ